MPSCSFLLCGTKLLLSSFPRVIVDLRVILTSWSQVFFLYLDELCPAFHFPFSLSKDCSSHSLLHSTPTALHSLQQPQLCAPSCASQPLSCTHHLLGGGALGLRSKLELCLQNYKDLVSLWCWQPLGSAFGSVFIQVYFWTLLLTFTVKIRSL